MMEKQNHINYAINILQHHKEELIANITKRSQLMPGTFRMDVEEDFIDGIDKAMTVLRQYLAAKEGK